MLFTGPLSPDSASREGKEVYITTLAIPVNSFEKAVQISIRLSKGPLPADVKIENSGSSNH
nr:hypothetical protein [uncultured Methanoregula sp.]